jgi:hypothetical protein
MMMMMMILVLMVSEIEKMQWEKRNVLAPNSLIHSTS